MFYVEVCFFWTPNNCFKFQPDWNVHLQTTAIFVKCAKKLIAHISEITEGVKILTLFFFLSNGACCICLGRMTHYCVYLATGYNKIR